MWRSALAAGLRSLARSRLYSGIGICGLAVGICAALLVGLVIQNQLSHERFIPGYERTYLAAMALVPTGRAPDYNRMTPSWMAGLLKLNFRQIEAIARLGQQDAILRQGKVSAIESIYWADPDIFDVLPLPAFAGDLKGALRQPDGMVLTRTAARKYFGRDDPIGQTIEIDGAHSMTVTAVIEDLPDNGTDLQTGIFASGLAAHSQQRRWWDNDPANSPKGPVVALAGRTYLRLKPQASIESLRQAMPQFIHTQVPIATALPGMRGMLELIRIDAVHLSPQFNPGIGARLAAATAVGLLILFVAVVNFINLSTARAARRAVEVSVRKVAGANRATLVRQFLGESLICVAVATCMALALAELMLPHVNAFLDAGAVLDFGRNPALLSWLAAGVLLLSVAAGIYPAFVLSAFRPAGVLKGSLLRSGDTSARRILVTLQFAVLIGLLICAGVVYTQRVYATTDALRFDAAQILVIRSPCHAAFKAEVYALPGVRGVFCSAESLLTAASFGNFRLKDGSPLAIDVVGAEWGVLESYGVRPLAGRFTPATAADAADSGQVVINETAVRRLGFASPAAAVGQLLPLLPDAGVSSGTQRIIGVAPDFSINAIEHEIRPVMYHPQPQGRFYSLIHVKLSGRDIPETLEAIDRLWMETGLQAPAHVHNRSAAAGAAGSIDRFFLDDYIQNLYVSLLREAQMFGIFSCIAVLLACLGLVGLSAATAERRAKEIGIRKALGAGTGQILRLLLWQFARPVLWASCIALPAGALLMDRWLEGFAYRVELKPLVFAGAAGASIAIALITVFVHSWRMAHAKPTSALRYE